MLIRAVMVTALKLDGDYCCCSVAAEMENGKKKESAFLCSTQKREREGNRKKKSDERWFSASIIFVTVYEYLRR